MDRSYQNIYSYRPIYYKKRKRKWPIYLFVVIAVSIGGIFVANNFSKSKATTQVILGNSGDPQVKAVQTVAPVPTYGSLEEAVNKSLEGTKGTYAVEIKNLKTDDEFSLNETRTYDAGSLYKLWVMATVFKQLEGGKLKEDQELSMGINELNQKFRISPDEAEQTGGTISLTVNEALNQMITISHNYAALLLTEKVKLSTVSAFLKTNGFTKSKVGTNGDVPKTTAADIKLFFEKLYYGKLGNEESTRKMTDLLKAQKLNNKLPLYLPQGTTIAHKTGEIGWFSHDGGIVYTDKGDYIIVVLSESESPKGAEDRIGQLSKAVYEYFTR